MSSVGIHPPKTPVTKGSSGIAKATLPNVCKMPGPPAPFVPSPLPNIAKSGSSPKGYSRNVKIERKPVAIRGASFKSMGDIASKGTGGGLISANTHGPAKFITPGSLTVKIEGKSVHLLGEPMLNNCGPSGSPPNTGATLTGVKQANQQQAPAFRLGVDCAKNVKEKGWDECCKEELCAKVKSLNEQRSKEGGLTKIPGASADPMYKSRKENYKEVFEIAVTSGDPRNEPWIKDQFFAECAYDKWNEAGRDPSPSKKPAEGGAEFANPDHVHDAALGGDLSDINNFKWLDSSVNKSIGGAMKNYDPAVDGEIKTHASCGCKQEKQ